MSNYKFVASTPDWVKPYIIKASETYKIPTLLLSAQLNQESGFNPNVSSGAGAKGIAQFIDSTAKAYGVNPWDVESSIMGQAHYMSDLLQQYGTVERALSAYNSGGPDNYLNKNFGKGETYNYVHSIVDSTRAASTNPAWTPPTPTPDSQKFNPKTEFASAEPFSPNQPISPIPNQSPTSYTVKPGDTLWGIAQKLTGNGANWQQLSGYSGDPRKLPVGTVINSPRPAPATPAPVPQPVQPAPAIPRPSWVQSPPAIKNNPLIPIWQQPIVKPAVAPPGVPLNVYNNFA